MKTIYFMRHGQSQANVEHINAGQMDSPLTEQGRQAAEKAGRYIRQELGRIDLIVSSTQSRARDTADIVAAKIGYPQEKIEYDERIREINIGTYSGQLQTPDQQARMWQDYLQPGNPAGVEPIGAVEERMRSFLDWLRQRPEETVLVIGHNGSGKMLRQLCGGEQSSMEAEIPNAQVFKMYPKVEASVEAA